MAKETTSILKPADDRYIRKRADKSYLPDIIVLVSFLVFCLHQFEDIERLGYQAQYNVVFALKLRVTIQLGSYLGKQGSRNSTRLFLTQKRVVHGMERAFPSLSKIPMPTIPHPFEVYWC